jgi:plastocyanin
MSRTRILSAIIVAMFAVAACGGTAATSAPTTAAQSEAPASAPAASESAAASEPASAAAAPCAASSAAGAVSVKIANFAFDPATVKAKVGDVITWTNTDSVKHTATVKGNEEACTTVPLDNEASGGITFSVAGTYDFFCKIHPQMTGKIEVTS